MQANFSGRNLSHQIPLGETVGRHVRPVDYVLRYLRGHASLRRILRERLAV